MRFASQVGYAPIPAVRDGEQHEVKSPSILRIRPAAIDGVDAPRADVSGWESVESGGIELIS